MILSIPVNKQKTNADSTRISFINGKKGRKKNLKV